MNLVFLFFLNGPKHFRWKLNMAVSRRIFERFQGATHPAMLIHILHCFRKLDIPIFAIWSPFSVVKPNFFLVKIIQHQDINPHFPWFFHHFFKYVHHVPSVFHDFWIFAGDSDSAAFAGARRSLRRGLRRGLRRAGGCNAAGGANAEAESSVLFGRSPRREFHDFHGIFHDFLLGL